MIRLNFPEEIPILSKIIDLCCQKNISCKQNILNSKKFLQTQGERYKNLAQTNELFRFESELPRNEFICGNLKNEHMVRLYEYCLRDSRVGGIYDTIINLAKDTKCPFCGGIGKPTQIDHFLPKSRYGHFSVLPDNLIPVCKDCNTEYKKEFTPTTENEQLIHPYLDNHAIFNEQWLYAKYIDDSSSIGSVEYYVNPPEQWSQDQKEKVHFHFRIFHLSERLSEFATGSLSDLITQMQEYKRSGNTAMEDFEIGSIDSIINREQRANSWKKALFCAVKEKLPIIWAKM